MRGIMRAVRAALRALRTVTRYVWERSVTTGEWIARAILSVGAGTVEEPAFEPSIQDTLLKPVAKPEVDEDIDRIQRVCRQLTRRLEPAPQDLQPLSDLERDWIYALSVPGRLVVGNVKAAAVRGHMRGGKTLRGVCAFDRDSVTAYVKATAPTGELVEGEDPEVVEQRNAGRRMLLG